MRKRRIFFMGIIIICFLLLALSISGLLEFTSYVKREAQPMLKTIVDESSKRKQRQNLDPNAKDVTQEIYGLYLPNYNKDGKEVSVIRGAYTIFLKNRIYRVTKPEIEFLSTSTSNNEDNNQPKSIIITSDFGDIDKTTNKGFLYENVIIRLEEDLKIYTDDLKYLPDEKTINTDGLVTVIGKGMRTTGLGFEISLSESKAWIKNDPEMEIDSNEGGALFFSQKKADASNLKNKTSIAKGNVAENIFIRSSGELVFENKKNLATFHDNVRISRGESTIFSDKLSIFFESDIKNVNKLIASGNVLASDGTKTAKGENLSWDAQKQIAILDDDPVAEFFDDKVSITAAKIKFFKDQGKIVVPVSGQLTMKVNMKKEHNKNKQDDNKETNLFLISSNKNTTYENIIITWKGRMTFQQGETPTIFEDDVIATRGETKLYCEKLIVTHDDKNETIEKLEAIKDVHFIEKRGDSTRVARGAKLIWIATGNYTELYGNPLASVKDSEKYISAPKIFFSEDENNMLAEGKGNLLVKTHTKKKEDSELIDISWHEKMVYNDKNKIANFYEKVHVIKGEEKLDCDKLDVLFYDKDEIKQLFAFGNVYIESPDLENTIGVGTLLVWDFAEDLAVLTGNPLAELRRSGARTFSEKIYFDINSKKVQWVGSPHWQIYERQQ